MPREPMDLPEDDRKPGWPTWKILALIGGSGCFLVIVIVGVFFVAVAAKVAKMPPKPVDDGMTPNAVFVEMADHPERFKGRTIKTIMTLDESIHAHRGVSLRDFEGKDVWVSPNQFRVGVRIGFKVRVPQSSGVPAAHYGDELLIEFVCKEGKLDSGNEAISITRP